MDFIYHRNTIHCKPVVVCLVSGLLIPGPIGICLPEPLVPIHHLAHCAVAILHHTVLVFFDGCFYKAVLFVRCCFCRAVGLVSPALRQMNQHPYDFLFR